MTEITCSGSSKTNPFASLVHIDFTMLYSMCDSESCSNERDAQRGFFQHPSLEIHRHSWSGPKMLIPRLEVSSTTLETLGENAARWPSEVYPVPMSGVCIYIIWIYIYIYYMDIYIYNMDIYIIWIYIYIYNMDIYIYMRHCFAYQVIQKRGVGFWTLL